MNLLGKTILSTAICINAIQFGYGEVITPESPDSGFGYKVQLAEDIALIVGPEGGFSPEEAAEIEAAGARQVSLGRRILRGENRQSPAVAGQR